MAIFAAFVIVPFGLILLVSGLIINLIQLIWLFDWWACIKINLYADAETLELLGKEHALVLCNHRGDIDWLIGWVTAQRSGCLGSTLAIMRKEAKYFPAGFNQLKDFPTTFWLALFVEGTRFTRENLEAAKDYASLKGVPSPRNVLIPRTKGFVSAVAHMRSFVPAIYDCTYTVHKKQSPPTFLSMFSGQPSEVNLQMRRYQMSQLPETADNIAQWLQDRFVAKDAQLENYFTTNDVFSDLDVHQICRPIKPLVVRHL
ncbi:1-acyl-sn-glycerol-3-phosphate acyltransferase 3 [Raphanus sativus]|nr:1-acyl-sn-glycerol-3-phosphate acyltransferase 3 [Raphanus sativus]